MDPIPQRLEHLYDEMRKRVEREGLDMARQEMIQKDFFTLKENQWTPEISFCTPSGLTVGNPFVLSLRKKLVALRQEITQTMHWPKDFYWAETPKRLHTTLISYSHYSEVGKKLICIPKVEEPTVQKIVYGCPPLDIYFHGVLLTTDGALLVTGTVETEDVFVLRERCRKEITGITQRPLNIIHIKLLQLLKPISKEEVGYVHAKFGLKEIGRYRFHTALTCWGTRLRFSTKASMQETT